MKKKRLLFTTVAAIAFFAGFLQLFFTFFQIDLSAISTAVATNSEDSFVRRSSQGGRITCDRSHRSYDICSVNGPTILDPGESALYAVKPAVSTRPDNSPPLAEVVRPYPRKWENFLMAGVKEVSLSPSGPKSPTCKANHGAPALVFSAGGYTGNFFHDFNDGFIPLYITVQTIFPHDDGELVLVIADAQDWWIQKYADLLRTFSKHRIITLENDTAATHCFPSATVGLISHGFMTIDPSLIPTSKSFLGFRSFLASAYDGPGGSRRTEAGPGLSRPRLVLASRSGGIGRVILNQAEVKRAAAEVGFDVTVFEPTRETPVREAYALVNSSHAMIGVHGAGLTHSMFLRRGAALVQVVPIGVEWASEHCFGRAARELGLEYVEYTVTAEESTLAAKYGKESPWVRDPGQVQKGAWLGDVMDVYLKHQNVRLNLNRFKAYLEKAYEKAKLLMDKEG